MGFLCDLLWSDPHPTATGELWVSFEFGVDAVTNFFGNMHWTSLSGGASGSGGWIQVLCGSTAGHYLSAPNHCCEFHNTGGNDLADLPGEGDHEQEA